MYQLVPLLDKIAVQLVFLAEYGGNDLEHRAEDLEDIVAGPGLHNGVRVLEGVFVLPFLGFLKFAIKLKIHVNGGVKKQGVLQLLLLKILESI